MNERDIHIDFLRVLATIAVICVLLFTKKIHLKSIPINLVQRIAPLTLGIYLIHPLWLWTLTITGVIGLLIFPVIGILLVTFLAFALSNICIGIGKNPNSKKNCCDLNRSIEQLRPPS
jgi:surface polysaccharide O-acyltransferase-like enzyme